MADAIGLAASIVQIISTGVQASVYLYSFAETVSSAGKAVKEISSDIELTTSVLEQLKTILESEKEHGTASKEAFSAAEALIQECSNIFEAVVTLIQKRFPDLGPGRRARSRLNFLKWPIIQPKIELMRSNLEKHKTKLILMTQVLTLAKMAVSQQREIDGQIENERQKLEALVIVSHRAKVESDYKINVFGLTEVFNPTTQASIDIVFVHGIFGHPKGTWTCDDTDVFWPAELLPPVLEDDGTRVLTYGYEAGADSFTDGEQTHKIRKATKRPLIFIAHSLGGLIVKGALAHSSRSPDMSVPDIRSISISTYGVVFLATPHNILASHMNLLCDTAIHKEKGMISHAIERLKAKHTALHLLNQKFLDIAHEYRHHCFQEMLEPKVCRTVLYAVISCAKPSVDGLQILDSYSARLSMLHSEATCIYLDHYRISKFGSRFSHGFDLVCAVIQDFVNRAPGFISSRWEDEGTKMLLQNSIPVSAKPSNTDKAPYPLSGRGCHVDESTWWSMRFTGSDSAAPTATVKNYRTEGGTFEPNPMDLQVPKKPLWTPSVASSEEIGDPGADSCFEFKTNRHPNQRVSVNELSQGPPHLIDVPEIHSNQTAGPEMEYPRKSKRIFSKSTFDTKRERGEPSKVDNEVDKSARQMSADIQTGKVVACSSSPNFTHPTIPFATNLSDVVLPPSPGMFRPSESSSGPLDGLADWTSRYRESRTQSRLFSIPCPPFEVQQYPVELAPMRNYTQHYYDNQSRDSGVYHPYQSPNCRYMPENNIPARSGGQEPHMYIHPPEQSSLLPSYPAHNQTQTQHSQPHSIQNHQGQAASLETEQTLNYPTPNTNLGQPCASDLTDGQVQRMDDYNFSAGFRYTNGASPAIPIDVKTSGMYLQQRALHQQRPLQQQAQSYQAQHAMLARLQAQSNQDHLQMLGQQQAQPSQSHSGTYVQQQAQPSQSHSGMYVQQQAQSNQDHLQMLGQQQAQSSQPHSGIYAQQPAYARQSHRFRTRRRACSDMKSQRDGPYPLQQSQHRRATTKSLHGGLSSTHSTPYSMVRDSIALPASKQSTVAGKKRKGYLGAIGMASKPSERTSPENRDTLQNFDFDSFLRSASPPPRSLPVSELQALDATEEERVKAKEEVLQLLRQWTKVPVTFLSREGRLFRAEHESVCV